MTSGMGPAIAGLFWQEGKAEVGTVIQQKSAPNQSAGKKSHFVFTTQCGAKRIRLT